MKLRHIYITALLLVLFGSACKKSAIIDGGLSKEKIDLTTTYDFLKSNPHQMFDTTLLIIDKAGMKDLINGPGTFFIPNDYAITNFLNTKRDEARKKNEKLNYNLDSLFKNFSPQMLRDSMAMYFFPEKIVRDGLTSEGKSYQSSTNGVVLDVSLEEADQYTVNGIITNKPKYVYLNKILGEKDVLEGLTKVDPSGDAKLLDIKALCQTSGIITNTGVVHVLSNSHIWTFKTKVSN
ncbi:fasciclin domain-containing protein [Pedobacter sp. NJ-S-72]